MTRRPWHERVPALVALAGGALVVALAAAPAYAADPTTVATTPATPPPASISGSVVPSVTISRAPTTAASGTQAPQTQAPQTQAPQTSPRTQAPSGTRATTATASTAARTTTTVARTTTTSAAPTTTEAPTTVADTEPPTSEAVVDDAATSTSIVQVGDPDSSHRISRIAWTLTAMGVLVGGLTLWFFFATRPAPAGMAGLAEMSSTRWWKADRAKRDAMLDRSRKGRADIADEQLVVGPTTLAAAAVADVELPAWARGPEHDLAASTPDGAGVTFAEAVAGAPSEAAIDPAPTPVPPVAVPLSASAESASAEAPAAIGVPSVETSEVAPIRVAPYAAEDPPPVLSGPSGPASPWAPPAVTNDNGSSDPATTVEHG